MAEEELGRIFSHLCQMGTSLTPQYGRIGLGLTLVRAVIEEHGGRIKVQSQPGQGSRFTIELPALSPAA
jgi:signal transduction histidine kinase